jgi:CheY-like chemotaxis protein/HPt (histidine-containing phosphotransfer) domain-containing protein
LLVEDTIVNQRLATRLLEKRGHTVVAVGDGKQALAALGIGTQASGIWRSGSPPTPDSGPPTPDSRALTPGFDLILMDVQMPEMGGFEATALIRAGEEKTGRHLPIIAMTARAMKGDEDHCLRVGMDGYMAKPFRTAKLVEILQSIGPGGLAVRAAAGAPVADTAEKLEPYDLRNLLGLLAEDDADDLLLATEVYVRHHLDEIAALEKAWKSGSNEELFNRAHRIKGGVAALRARRAQRIANEIEVAARQGDRETAGKKIPDLIAEMHHMTESIRLGSDKKNSLE